MYLRSLGPGSSGMAETQFSYKTRSAELKSCPWRFFLFQYEKLWNQQAEAEEFQLLGSSLGYRVPPM